MAEPPSKAARRAAEPRFNRTMLRVRDPCVSVDFYQTHFNMSLVHWMRSGDGTSYFLERQRHGLASPACTMKDTSAACEQYLHSTSGCCLELRHIHGTEADPEFSGYWSGNTGADADGALLAESPLARGFGHIAFNVKSVRRYCKKLESAGVKFQKKPDEGRMKGLAFALDPDGYWIEICSRGSGLRWEETENLSQTMLRVKDGPRTVEFYTKYFGMKLLRQSDFKRWKFSLYFLASLTAEEEAAAREIPASSSSSEEDLPSPSRLWSPVLELTWNHGTEKHPAFQVHNGNSDPLGFGHVGFLVDDLDGLRGRMAADGITFKDAAGPGGPRRAIALDPNGYYVELVERCARFESVNDSN